MALILAAVGALLIAAGCALVFPPAGVVVAGVELVCAGYVVRFLQAKGG